MSDLWNEAFYDNPGSTIDFDINRRDLGSFAIQKFDHNLIYFLAES